jgi:hypothetical protein
VFPYKGVCFIFTRMRVVVTICLLFLFYHDRFKAQFPNTLISRKPVTLQKNESSEDQSLITTGNYRSYTDKKNGTMYMIWTRFEKYKLGEKNGTSSIMFNGLLPKKNEWTPTLCLSTHKGSSCYPDTDSTLAASEIGIGSNGEMYVAWGGPAGLAFQRSMDTGKTWLPEEKIICALKKGWRITEKNGCQFKGAPAMTCVKGNNSNKGRIYITWSDARNGKNNEDVFMVYSDDKGDTWTDPVIITYRPNHKAQFQPMMTVDSTSGYLYLMYYDQQNFLKDDFTDLYLSIGKEGGLKFEHYRLNEIPIPLDKQSNLNFLIKQSEYLFIPEDHEQMHLRNGLKTTWLYTDENKMQNFFEAKVNDSLIKEYNKKYPEGEIEINRSFGFSRKMEIKFYSPHETILTAALTKPLEPGFEKVVVKDKLVKKGYNTLTIYSEELNIKKGNYVLTLYYNHRNTYVWITEE